MVRIFTALTAALLLSAASAAPAQADALNDAQIAHIAYTAGEIDIDAARVALAISHDAAVRDFAQTMLRDHQAVNEQAVALVTRLGVTPEANETSATLSEEADERLAALRALDGAAFDRAYVQNEVAYHAAVNSALESTLIPGAHNAELKALLESGLALFEAHQHHAEQLARQVQ